MSAGHVEVHGGQWQLHVFSCQGLRVFLFVCFDKLHWEERIPLTLNFLTHIPTFPEAMAQSATFDKMEDRANGSWGPTKSLSHVRQVILYTLPFNWNTKKLEQKSESLWSGHGEHRYKPVSHLSLYAEVCVLFTIYDITIIYYCFWMMPLYKSIPSTIGQLRGHLKDPWESSKMTRERLLEPVLPSLFMGSLLPTSPPPPHSQSTA